jgi:hypothetical protein
MYFSFLAGLLSYEGAIVAPILVLLAAPIARNAKHPLARSHLLILALLAIIYGAVWNIFFRFRITRFPVEHSP